MLIYNVGIWLLHFFISIYSLVNDKAKLFVNGRKKSFKQLSEFARLRNESEKVYWFHCASLGEFEQARPLIETIKKESPGIQIAISFFSPSGFEIQKNYSFADLVFYLPMASKSNSIKVLNLLQPTKIFFIKYEFWIHYINSAHTKGIPVYLVSALFRPGQIFFQWYGKLFFNILSKYTKIFVQDETSLLILQKYNIKSLVTGDTRFDRVITNKTNARKNELVEQFAGGKKIIVLGSSWSKEEEMIFQAYDAKLNYKIIIAPHDINRKINVPETFSSVKYSMANIETIKSYEVLIIDNIGMLSTLYSYASIAFVGGGFHGSLHNILEPAVFGIPVLYGFQTQKHPEAEVLEEAGGGIILREEIQLKTTLEQLFSDPAKISIMGNNARQFVENSSGATQKILREI